MKYPLVSIIVPLYNKKKHLDELFNSLLSQSHRTIEVVIVDDGSTDGSAEVVKAYAKKDSRIIYIYQLNQGVSVARNNGINVANGEYISFIDADDYYDSQFVEKMLVHIKQSNICYTGHNLVYGDRILKANIEFKQGDILCNYFLNRVTPNTNSWLIRKSFLTEHQLYFHEKLDWGEDMLYFGNLLTIDRGVSVCPEYLTYYRKEVQGSLSVNHLDKIEKDLTWINLYKEVLQKSCSDKRKLAVERVIDGYFMPALVTYRIFLNRKIVPALELTKYIQEYKVVIKKDRLLNGLKSIKLRVCRIYLILKFN